MFSLFNKKVMNEEAAKNFWEWFIEKEYEVIYGCEYPTGRTRRAVNCLYCPCCLKQYVVDDSFDGPWR